jgi:hypothetical protein
MTCPLWRGRPFRDGLDDQAAGGPASIGNDRHGISSPMRLIGCPSAILASVSRR